MQVPMFRAKDRDSDEIVEGFYGNYPLTNSKEDVNDVSAIVNTEVVHCIYTYKSDPLSMGLTNKPIGCTIDISTLEFVRMVEVPCGMDSPIILK